MSDIADGLRAPLFECYLYGDLLDLVNKQRADGADEIERLRLALREITTPAYEYLSDAGAAKHKIKIARAALGENE